MNERRRKRAIAHLQCTPALGIQRQAPETSQETPSQQPTPTKGQTICRRQHKQIQIIEFGSPSGAASNLGLTIVTLADFSDY